MVGALGQFIDRWTVSFTRQIPRPPADVWRAVSEADQIAVWFVGPAKLDLRVGGAWAFGPGNPPGLHGTVRSFEASKSLVFDGPHPGPDAWWRIDLAEEAGGTRLTLSQRIGPDSWTNPHGWPADPPDHPAGDANPWRPGTLAGWHGALDHLEDLLAGAPLRRLDMAGLEVAYRAHMLATQP